MTYVGEHEKHFELGWEKSWRVAVGGVTKKKKSWRVAVGGVIHGRTNERSVGSGV